MINNSNNNNTKHGRHHASKVQFGAMVEPRFKAIAVVTAACLDCTLVDLIRHGVEDLAIKAGVLKDGQVTDKYREAVDAQADIIAAVLAETREQKRGTK